jgi:hypothetical protein
MGAGGKDDVDERRLASLAKRVLAMPHKPRDEMKIGKRRAEPSKIRPASKGRVHKGKPRA